MKSADDPKVHLLTNIMIQLDKQAEMLAHIAYALSVVDQPAIRTDVHKVRQEIESSSRRIFRYMETHLDIQDSS